jgi:membrane protease YdiL (CAAX protease family)
VKTFFHKILGLDRCQELYAHWCVAGDQRLSPELSSRTVFVGVLVAALPVAAAFLTNTTELQTILTYTVGLATLFAIVFRYRSGILLQSVGSWRDALKITHTAFALGCLPALIVLAFDAEGLTGLRKEEISSSYVQEGRPDRTAILLWILQVSAWAAITEEFIFRGMLVSVLRRWRVIANKPWRDASAVFLSAALFGLAHLPVWGPSLALATFALGLGFGIAFIATGEVVMPLVVYHFLFNTASLSFALFIR